MRDFKSPANSKTTYLVVDDHPMFRSLLRTVLSGPDSEVFEESNGESALQAYQNLRPTWVIMDIEMPLMDGLSATKHLKSIHPEARIAIVTQHNQDAYREEAMANGAELFISKDNVIQLKDILNR